MTYMMTGVRGSKAKRLKVLGTKELAAIMLLILGGDDGAQEPGGQKNGRGHS